MIWGDGKAAQATVQEIRRLKAPVEALESAEKLAEDAGVLFELSDETGDLDSLREAEGLVENLVKALDKMELTFLLSGPYDAHDAILAIHGGAGGTEAMDWAQMLYRMYTRFCEREGFKVELLDLLPGEEAGIKSVTFQISGLNAYGYMKAEKGVHRLVRMSPFDSSGRRHTSFASLDVLPVLEDEEEIQINSDDLRIDTFRSGGAGGQHVNKTDSAVRITHLPTGIVVGCQNERSQLANRDTAMRILRAKLLEKQEEEQRQQIGVLRGDQGDIAWGNQIRSYVFQPYTMVKDHRTGHEVGDVNSVMDGEIGLFIRIYLEAEAERRAKADLQSPGAS